MTEPQPHPQPHPQPQSGPAGQPAHPDPIRVLVVDDQTIVRKGTRALLELVDGIEVVGEAVNGADAVTQAEALRPNVVLMDLMMPVLDGVAATERIVASYPDVYVIALTSFGEDDKLLATLRAGALGYVLKDADTEALVAAIRQVADGNPWLPPAMARRVLAQFSNPAPPPLPLDPLTERELAVLALLAQGKSNPQMALELGISETTVRTHVSRILDKLECENRVQAVLLALQLGLVELPDRTRPTAP